MSLTNHLSLAVTLIGAATCQFSSAQPTSRAATPLPASQAADVVVYGGTSAGVIAAVQVAKMGKQVVLISPDRHLGGMSSGGLGWTDIGNKQVIGGLSRQFYRQVWRHYRDDDAWRWQARDEFGGQAQGARIGPEDASMWVFEPHVAEKVFNDMISEAGVTVMHARLDLGGGVLKDGARIVALRTEDGRKFSARVFIDATYEGDLMARAGVKYVVGRESNATYDETLNGVQTARATKNQLPGGIDAYVRQGDPASGLLPGVNTDPGEDGSGDHRLQAYCFRMCLTDVPRNRVPVDKPADYDEARYEILFRAIEAGQQDRFFTLSLMPNRKTDSNNSGGISNDFIGMNYEYAEADYDTRARIIAAHESWQKGLLWTLQHHPRVPPTIREKYGQWGLPRDEFVDNGHWPHQLYIREARRMVGVSVMTQHHCQGREVAKDPIAMAAYTMDSHNVQRHVDENGHVRNEGDVQVGGFPPFPIGFGAIVPRRAECSNLLVPVCLSASHIAFGSIRMEPVFMILGQSAATAAVHAIDERSAVQDVAYERLRARLIADEQILARE